MSFSQKGHPPNDKLNSSLIGDIAEVFTNSTKFPVAIVCGSESKVSFCISRDHMMNESRDSMGEIPSS